MVRRLFAIIALVSVAMIGSVAATTQPAGHVRAVVAFVGDSNETLSMSALGLELQPYIVVNAAWFGATIRYSDCVGSTTCATYNFWQTRLTEMKAKMSPDGYVVDLGINDALAFGSATSPGYASYGQKIDWLMRQLGGKPTFWTNLPCVIEPASRRKGCVVVNRALAAAIARWPNLRVLDWASVANSHPKWLGGFGGVHFTAEASLAWAALVKSAVSSRFPA